MKLTLESIKTVSLMKTDKIFKCFQVVEDVKKGRSGVRLEGQNEDNIFSKGILMQINKTTWEELPLVADFLFSFFRRTKRSSSYVGDLGPTPGGTYAFMMLGKFICRVISG